MSPGASLDHGKHKSGTCFGRFVCKHPSHSSEQFPRRKHVLVCEQHKDDEKNLELLEKYKKEKMFQFLPEHSKNVRLSFHSSDQGSASLQDFEAEENEVADSAIYIMQTIVVDQEDINIFYDNGCKEFVCSKEGVDKLEKSGHATLKVPGPLYIGGVGNTVTVSDHGAYKVSISTCEGEPVPMTGICLDEITCEFPKYPLGEVERDVRSQYKKAGYNPKTLPRLLKHVGGKTHLMIGIKYLKYYPKFVFQLLCGLVIYRSEFYNRDGSRGVVGGPHYCFTELEKQLGSSHLSLGTYLSQQLALYRSGHLVNPDAKLLSGSPLSSEDIEVNPKDFVAESHLSKVLARKRKVFEDVENAGSEHTYRCPSHRDCRDCKISEELQSISFEDELSQMLIDNSVHVDQEKGETTATLPFLENPETALASNRSIAMSVYKAQVRKLDRSPKDKQDVIESERKMQELGFVDALENLTDEQRKRIFDSALQYFIPWRAVWNLNSLSTSCRLVFDGSHPTATGKSLNSISPKGMNLMNKMVQIVIRWFIKRFGFHTDIRKMYNTVKLDEEYWQYQLYLWHDQLSISEEPIIKVIKTLIYGLRASGNQAESALRKTAALESNSYPKACQVINRDTYVDDCISGTDTEIERDQVCHDLQLVISRGGFALKGFTFTGKDPPAEFTTDGVSVKVGGMKVYPKEDLISIITGDMNFSKKRRGKKSQDVRGIPQEFSRRDCAGKVYEVFDLVGKIVPITSGLKLDLRTLVTRKLDWDDPIPSDLKELWLANFQTIKDLADVKYQRCVVPEDAVNLEVNTLDLGDASQSLVCAAIYARYLRKDGSYSCQQIFAKSKLVPDGMFIPRAELLAAHLNSTIGHVVKLSLGDYHKDSIKFTDSQVSLFWISNTKNPLKPWTRNKVIDIVRFTDRSSWVYVKGADNVADLGTRKGAKISDVSPDSKWIRGLDWMRKHRKDFPVSTVEDLRFQQSELEAVKKESLTPDLADSFFVRFSVKPKSMKSVYTVSKTSRRSKVDSKIVAERYKFADYIIDPNRFRLQKVVRVLALVLRYVRNFVKKWSKDSKKILPSANGQVAEIPQKILDRLSPEKFAVTCGNVYSVTNATGKVTQVSCPPGLVVCVSDEDISLSLQYYFKKCTSEVKHFVNKKEYEKISVEKDGILKYKGRILPSQKFDGVLKLSDVMLDLTSSTFSVPIVDKSSPFAFAVVNEIHWYHSVAAHSGNETVWRYVLMFCYILGGKEVVRSFRKDCARCRYLAKRTVDVVMGPVSDYNLMLAPAFYVSQVDLFGPVKAYSLHNKRGTVSVWFLIFCCSTTGAINVKVMEDYTTSSFVFGFIRFSSQVGYPKVLLPDEGSQLIKGCKEMQLCFTDIKQRLHVEFDVDFEPCPVGGHNMHGKVERKIQHVKQVMDRELHKDRLSVLQWETVGDQIANCVNDTPLAVRYVPSDVEQMDLLTPNRLMLGRNNDRSPAAPVTMSNNPGKLIQQNERIVNAWFECWLTSHVPKLIDQPKWFDSDADVQVGDVVLFLKKEKEFAGNYQYGIVKSVESSKDSKIRKVMVEYVNSTEETRRETRRSVRELVVIHPVDELGIIRELGQISTWVDMRKKLNCSS